MHGLCVYTVFPDCAAVDLQRVEQSRMHVGKALARDGDGLAQRMPVHSVEDFGRAVVEDNAGPLFRPGNGELAAAYAADDSRIAVHCRSSVSISSSAGALSRFLLSGNPCASSARWFSARQAGRFTGDDPGLGLDLRQRLLHQRIRLLTTLKVRRSLVQQQPARSVEVLFKRVEA